MYDLKIIDGWLCVKDNGTWRPIFLLTDEQKKEWKSEMTSFEADLAGIQTV